MTAFGLLVAVSGLAMFVLSVGLGFVYVAVGSESQAGFALMAGMGYGFQFAVLGACIAVLSLAGHWFVRGFRSCPVWRSAR
jgi:hypothetical protein